MNSRNVIKKDLLRRKINEYFTKHPSAKSVIIKADIGEAKTLWKVSREGKSFKIVEVNTKREEFIMEAPLYGTASSPFVQLSVLATQTGLAALGHPEGRRKFAQQALPLISKMQGNEKTQARMLLGNLGFNEQELRTLLKLGPQTSTTQTAPSPMPGVQSMSTMKEEDEKEPKKKKDDDKDEKKDDEKKKSTKPKPKSPPKATDKLEPEAPPEDETGLETSTDMEEPAPDAAGPIKPQSSEEMAVSQNLSGQTIKSASVVLTPGGGKLVLDLVSSSMPAELEWSRTGKVIFHFNGRPYVLKRE